MKPVFLNLVRRISCPAIIFLLLLNTNLFPQVTIKEKIEIDPSDTVKTITGKDFNIKSIRNKFFSAQSGIFLSNNSMVTVYFWDSDGNYVHDLFLNGELIVPNALLGFEPYTACFDQGTELDFSLYMHEPYNKWETDKIYEQVADNEYLIYFEDYSDYDYNDLIIDVYIDPIGLNITQSEETIYTGGNCILNCTVFGGCFGVEVPEEFTYDISIITGEQYGNLYEISSSMGKKSLINNNNTVSNISSVTNLVLNSELGCCIDVEYRADGEEPSQEVEVLFRVSTSIPGIEPQIVRLLVWPPGIKVDVDPPEVAPGDTAMILIKKRNPDGSIEDFTSDKRFEIGMLDGCMLGKIYVPGYEPNSYFPELVPPVYFIADTAADSGIVKIKVGLIEEGGATSILPFLIDSSNIEYTLFLKNLNEIKQRTSKIILSKKNKLTKAALSIAEGESCFYGDITAVVWGRTSFSIGKREVEIIYPTINSTEWITQEPSMPNVVCKARLKDYRGGIIYFEWEYWISYELKRVAPFKTLNETCSRFGKSVFKGFTVGLNNEICEWTVPFKKTNGEFVFKGKHYSMEGGCESTTTEWIEGENVFTGGDVFIQVTVKDQSEKIIGFKQMNAGKLLGSNPEHSAIVDYTDPIEFRAIISHESEAKQFNNEDTDLRYTKKNITLEGWIYNRSGYPVYGPPNGYGLGQLDCYRSPTELQLWNWKANLDGSKSKYFYARNKALNHVKNHTYNNEILLKCLYQYYNSGKFYYDWNEKNGWEKRTDLTIDYGNLVYKKYLELIR